MFFASWSVLIALATWRALKLHSYTQGCFQPTVRGNECWLIGRKVHPGGLMLSWDILALFHHVPPPSSPPLKSETALPTNNFWIFLNISLTGKILGFSYDQRGIAVVEKPGIEFGQYLSEFLAWPRTGKSRRYSVNQWTFSGYMNILLIFISYPIWRQHFARRNLSP